MLPSSESQNEDIVPDDFLASPRSLKSSISHRDTAIGLSLTPK